MSDLDVLPPDLKALLDVERDRPAPPEAVQQRVKNRLELSVFAVGAGALVVTQVKWAKVGLALAKPWVAVPFAGVVVGAVAAVYLSVGPPVAKPRPETPVVEVVIPPPPAAIAEPTVPEALVVVDAGVDLPEPAPVVVAPPPPPKQVIGERALIENARAALARRKLNEAEAALAEHWRRFHDGALAEERDALSVELLISAGKTDEADAATKAFRARYPNSLLLKGAAWPGGFKK